MEFIEISKQQYVTTIHLNRPAKRNALHQAMIQELLQTITMLMHDEQTRILVVQARGETFCAGADIEWMKHITARSYDENVDDAQLLADLFYKLYHFPKPTLALVQGAALGGGLGLLTACDIAIATETAQFGFSEVRLGITPSCISPYVIAAIGERQARYYFLTGEKFAAHEAKRLGLIHQVVAENALESSGKNIIKELLNNGPKALSSVKQLINYVAHEKITEHLAQKTAEHLAQIRISPEAQKGLQAFVEKRVPQWE